MNVALAVREDFFDVLSNSLAVTIFAFTTSRCELTLLFSIFTGMSPHQLQIIHVFPFKQNVDT